MATLTPTTYTIKPGDYLSKIAPQFGITWRELYEANKAVIGANPNKIYPGQVLTIPTRAGVSPSLTIPGISAPTTTKTTTPAVLSSQVEEATK